MSSLQQSIYTMDEPNSINNLPDSLLIEIFIRLPTSESAHLCKPVCKRWLSLLSDHHFIHRFIHHHRHHRRHSSSTLIVQFKYFHYDIRTDEKGTTRFKVYAITDHPARDDTSYLGFLPCYEPDTPPHIAASNKDLLICYDKFSFRKTIYYLCNPLTKQWLALPPAPTRVSDSDGLVGFIITDEDNNAMYNYKLVQIPKLDSGNARNGFKAEIFSSKSCEWSESVVVSPQKLKKSSSNKHVNAVIFEGNLHWILDSKSILKLGMNPNDQCECGVIDLPTLETTQTRGMEYYCLGVCQGHLRVCLLLREVIVVWEMKEYDAGEWFIKYEIYLDEMEFLRNNYRSHQLYVSSVTEVLAFDTNDEDVLYLRYMNQIVLCNMQQSTVEVIGVCLSDRRLIIRGLTTFSLVHPCWPSPIPPLQYASTSAH